MSSAVFETHLHHNTGLRGLGIVLLAAAGLLCLGAAFNTEKVGKPMVVLLGIVLLFFTTHTLFSAQDFAVDRARSRYRHFSSLFGLKLGVWHPLPPVDGVVMKYFAAYTTAAGNGDTGWGVWEPNGPIRHYIVMLSMLDDKARAIPVFKLPFQEKDKAALVTAELSEYLAVPTHYFDAPLRRR